MEYFWCCRADQKCYWLLLLFIFYYYYYYYLLLLLFIIIIIYYSYDLFIFSFLGSLSEKKQRKKRKKRKSDIFKMEMRTTNPGISPVAITKEEHKTHQTLQNLARFSLSLSKTQKKEKKKEKKKSKKKNKKSNYSNKGIKYLFPFEII